MALTVEYMPWTHRLWTEFPQIADGHLTVPTKPGLGLEFNQDTLTRFTIA